MPNWASNSLTVTNPEVVAILKTGEGDEDFPLFHTFVPRPSEYDGIITGSTTIDGEKCRQWREINGETIPVLEEEIAELKKKYGAKDWYDWNIEHWGTKWDASSVSIDIIADDHAVVLFDTPWGPPVAWLERVVADYPDGSYTLAYAEGGMSYYGTIRYLDGEQVSQKEFDDFWSDEQDEEGCALPTQAASRHLEYYGLHTGG